MRWSQNGHKLSKQARIIELVDASDLKSSGYKNLAFS